MRISDWSSDVCSSDLPLSVRHLRSGLGTRSLRGGAVTMLAQAAKTLLQFASVAVLARLLAPQAFGPVALVAVVMILLEQFKDLGLSTAAVPRGADRKSGG